MSNADFMDENSGIDLSWHSKRECKDEAHPNTPGFPCHPESPLITPSRVSTNFLGPQPLFLESLSWITDYGVLCGVEAFARVPWFGG